MIAGDRAARVYTLATGVPSGVGARTEACSRVTHARMTLLDPAGRPYRLNRSLGRFVLSGGVIAYVETQFGVDSGSTSIHVVDVVRRRALRVLARVGYYVDAGILGAESVTDLVVAADGSLAWISDRSSGRMRAHELAVHAAAAAGAPHVIDEGGDIGSESLALSRGTLTWRHAGVQRSAALR